MSHQSEVSSSASKWRRLLGWIDSGEPHPTRGPFARWPRATDAGLAVLVFMGSLVTVGASSLGDDFSIGAIGDLPAGSLALLAVAAVALVWRRQRSIAVAAVVMAVMIGWALAGYGDGQDLAVMLAIYSVGRYTDDHRLSFAAVAVVSTISILDTIIDANQRIDIAPAIILTALPWYVGRRVRNRGDYLLLLRERAERLEADQLARARQAVTDERTRIARELHDVVAHQVSMMTVQAGAAKMVARDDLDAAVDAMTDVEHAGRQALGELRHLLGVLRPDKPDSDDLGPQPGLADIPALVDEINHAGADASVTLAPMPGVLPPGVELAVYRIVQESFTNIIKHAGPGPAVELSIVIDDFGLVATITNTTAGAAEPPVLESGYGIAGMRERTALLGGSLIAEPHPPNHFSVTARIPLGKEGP